MLARGQDPEGRGLLVALRDPEARSGTMLEHWRFRLENAALCTSGSYERFREIDGRRVSHIVDPRSGKPVTDHVLQASVIAPDCETADALATALMVLPPAEGMAVIESLPGIEAVLVQRNGRELTFTPSSGFMALIGEESR